MSSKSSATQASSTVYDTDTTNTNVTGTEGLAVVESDNNVLNILDAGAIENAFNFAGETVTTAREGVADVLTFSKSIINDSVERAGSGFDKALSKVSGAYDAARSDDKEDLLKIGLLLTAGVVAAGMVYKK